jgi:hypothetical protein
MGSVKLSGALRIDEYSFKLWGLKIYLPADQDS